MTRQELVALAQDVAMGTSTISTRSGLRVVVIVTDAEGEWVGVGTNTSEDDTFALLVSAAAEEGKEPA